MPELEPGWKYTPDSHPLRIQMCLDHEADLRKHHPLEEIRNFKNPYTNLRRLPYKVLQSCGPEFRKNCR